MDILNYPVQLNRASRNNVSCDFCAEEFGTVKEKNVHILDHFEQNICQRCDQTLVRIGGNFYILHSTLTCISSTELEQQTHLGDRSSIDPHPFSDDSEENQESDGDGTSLGSTNTNFDAPSLTIPETGTNKPVEQFHHLTDADETNIENEIDAEDTDAVPSSQTQKCNSTLTKKASSKFSDSECTEKKYDCTKCGSTNLTNRSLKRHHQIPNFKCRECGIAFCQLSHLKEHYKTHPGANPDDGIDVRSNQSIKQAKAQRKSKKFHCPVDGCTEMVSTESRQNHLKSKHNHFRFECDICKKVFQTLSVIREHMTVHGAICKLYTCDMCGETNIPNYVRQKYHKQNVVCVWCDRRFCLRRQLNQHHIEDRCGPDKPLGLSMLKKKIKRFKCKVEGCSEMVSTNNRSYHMAKKHRAESELFQCDICKKFFVNKSLVRIHILRVHAPSSKKFKCDLCGKAYLTPSILHWHHKNVHIKERKFQCSECGKTFVQKAQLKLHIFTHTGEKPFECTFDGCSKRFRTSAAQVEHLRAHTGEKPYKCPVADCDRKFAYGVDLRRHKYSAHGIFTKQFPCQICDEIFPENMVLKKHMKKHNLQE